MVHIREVQDATLHEAMPFSQSPVADLLRRRRVRSIGALNSRLRARLTIS